jgi:hypothetical protein
MIELIMAFIYLLMVPSQEVEHLSNATPTKYTKAPEAILAIANQGLG